MEFLVGFLIVVALLFLPCIYQWLTVSHDRIHVSEKSVKVETSLVFSGGRHYVGMAGRSVYMVFTRDGRAFKNKDSLAFWKWNSDEIQAKLKNGGVYYVKTAGLRVPFLGLHRNIITIGGKIKKAPK
ncbi:MAG: hypothetical protein LBH41_02765 [Rickettsiales bacterium]|jgi:hypothetical protein|nr:hypothetical protein [Rickettsiales bacterium]